MIQGLVESDREVRGSESCITDGATEVTFRKSCFLTMFWNAVDCNEEKQQLM